MDYDKTFWQEAKLKSLEPGGFGKDRVHLWAKLLNVNVNIDTEITVTDFETLPVHADEQQIRLDTDRSFVMYPDGDVQGHQESLNKLLVSLFRRHPSLSYFQGYHDIITVLFLTLPPSLQFPCAEKISLHRTRDAMGNGLEPILGLLRFLAKLIAAVDAEFAKLLKRAAPLPYFALSNLLTMFAHDVPTLPLIQHVFDYLLARPPIALVYLTAAVILARRDELVALDEDEDGDLGMIHSVLGALPHMSDDPISGETVIEFQNEHRAEAVEAENSRQPSLHPIPDTDADTSRDEFYLIADETDTDTIAESESYEDTETMLGSDVDTNSDSGPLKLSDLSASPLGRSRTSPLREFLHRPSLLSEHFLNESQTQLHQNFYQSSSSSPSASQSSRIDSPHSLSLSSSDMTNLPARDTSSSSLFETQLPLNGITPPKRAKKPIPLSAFLREADRLMEAYPPYQGYSNNLSPSSSPSNSSTSLSSVKSPGSSLAPVLSSIMGPLSVVYTWSEDPTKLPSDTDAESMIRDTSRVVYPWDGQEDVDEFEQGEKENTCDSTRPRRRFEDGRVLRRPELVLSVGAGAVLVIAIALAMLSNRGTRGERQSFEKLLGILGVWGAWGWNWVSR
ncbi:rab-GTPase-TBC domain-containing protein [Lentinula aciculospora]|uniref:Rab-GTPase-TBC domain-containing protein n=1 Tax=Lentinula aciculospora TaxID=153920 RepID=A0A9W9ACY6_9AGAR|nr:rab-GTPase-TBC domain-containing protein [Lentinula aciculospora]